MKEKRIILVALVLVVSLSAHGQTKSRSEPSLPAPAASLSIEARKVLRTGDAKPVAQTTFVLLDEDLNTILRPFIQIGFNKPLTAELLGPELELLKTFGDSEKGFGKYSPVQLRAMREQLIAAVATHTVASATTDVTGKATFQGLTPGIRFLYGYFPLGRTATSWHLRLELKSGTNSPVVLSNDNMIP